MKRSLSLFILMLAVLVSSALGSGVYAGDLAPNPTKVPTTVPDSDGDGIPDTDDLCPNRPGPRENRGCPLVKEERPTATPAPGGAIDTDGDGIPDANDKCPTVGGTAENGGCPLTNDPVPAPDSDGDGKADAEDKCPKVAGSGPDGCPPFVPPALPTDGCYVTPNGTFSVHVRNAPLAAAPIIGSIPSGKVYPAQGYFIIGTELWFLMADYEGNIGDPGYASRSALLATACPQLAEYEDETGFEVLGAIEMIERAGDADDKPTEDVAFYYNKIAFSYAQTRDTLSLDFNDMALEKLPTHHDNDDGTTTVEYCIYQEVKEAGVFEEVCYEVEIPEGCVLTTAEAGVYTVECEEEPTVTINPLIEGLPKVELTIQRDDTGKATPKLMQAAINGLP